MFGVYDIDSNIRYLGYPAGVVFSMVSGYDNNVFAKVGPFLSDREYGFYSISDGLSRISNSIRRSYGQNSTERNFSWLYIKSKNIIVLRINSEFKDVLYIHLDGSIQLSIPFYSRGGVVYNRNFNASAVYDTIIYDEFEYNILYTDEDVIDRLEDIWDLADYDEESRNLVEIWTKRYGRQCFLFRLGDLDVAVDSDGKFCNDNYKFFVLVKYSFNYGCCDRVQGGIERISKRGITACKSHPIKLNVVFPKEIKLLIIFDIREYVSISMPNTNGFKVRYISVRSDVFDLPAAKDFFSSEYYINPNSKGRIFDNFEYLMDSIKWRDEIRVVLIITDNKIAEFDMERVRRLIIQNSLKLFIYSYVESEKFVDDPYIEFHSVKDMDNPLSVLSNIKFEMIPIGNCLKDILEVNINGTNEFNIDCDGEPKSNYYVVQGRGTYYMNFRSPFIDCRGAFSNGFGSDEVNDGIHQATSASLISDSIERIGELNSGSRRIPYNKYVGESVSYSCDEDKCIRNLTHYVYTVIAGSRKMVVDVEKAGKITSINLRGMIRTHSNISVIFIRYPRYGRIYINKVMVVDKRYSADSIFGYSPPINRNVSLEKVEYAVIDENYDMPVAVGHINIQLNRSGKVVSGKYEYPDHSLGGLENEIFIDEFYESAGRKSSEDSSPLSDRSVGSLGEGSRLYFNQQSESYDVKTRRSSLSGSVKRIVVQPYGEKEITLSEVSYSNDSVAFKTVKPKYGMLKFLYGYRKPFMEPGRSGKIIKKVYLYTSTLAKGFDSFSYITIDGELKSDRKNVEIYIKDYKPRSRSIELEVGLEKTFLIDIIEPNAGFSLHLCGRGKSPISAMILKGEYDVIGNCIKARFDAGTRYLMFKISEKDLEVSGVNRLVAEYEYRLEGIVDSDLYTIRLYSNYRVRSVVIEGSKKLDLSEYLTNLNGDGIEYMFEYMTGNIDINIDNGTPDLHGKFDGKLEVYAPGYMGDGENVVLTFLASKNGADEIIKIIARVYGYGIATRLKYLSVTRDVEVRLPLLDKEYIITKEGIVPYVRIRKGPDAGELTSSKGLLDKFGVDDIYYRVTGASGCNTKIEYELGYGDMEVVLKCVLIIGFDSTLNKGKKVPDYECRKVNLILANMTKIGDGYDEHDVGVDADLDVGVDAGLDVGTDVNVGVGLDVDLDLGEDELVESGYSENFFIVAYAVIVVLTVISI